MPAGSTAGANIPPSLYTNVIEPVFHRGTDNWSPIPRYAGVELEFHNFKNEQTPEMLEPLKTAVTKWGGDIIQDHKNAEIRMAPAKREKFIQQVLDITTPLNVLEPVMGTPPEVISGFHVHVDCRDLKFRHLGHLMVVYSRLEPWILRTQPYSRFTSKFCRPIGPQLGDGWTDALSPQSQSQLYEMKSTQYVPGGENNRYKAVNFAAWYKHKTIEIRCHEGTTEPDEIIHWASLWTNFVENAKDIKFHEAIKWPKTLSALRDLVGEDGAHYLTQRIARYRDQWSEAKMAKIMPPVSNNICHGNWGTENGGCGLPAVFPHHKPIYCAFHG